MLRGVVQNMQNEYKEARKQAQKEYRGNISRGEYPYLLTLDDILPQERISQAVSIGTVQIPMEHIVGTRTGTRSNAFARNFLPLMGENTEFAYKWQSLANAHEEEGIRDPIKVYEYLNRFYVEEGNKRVSVMRYFGVDNVLADVSRVMPDRNNPDNALYFEFLEFYKESGIYYLEFTKSGSYRRFSKLMEKKPGEKWTEEERRSFSTAYYYFRKAYIEQGGESLSTTVGDALLAYMDIYGFQSLKDCTEAEISKLVAKVWEEIILQQEPEPIAINVEPAEIGSDKLKNILDKVLEIGGVKSKKKTLVAFLYNSRPKASGWVSSHEAGRAYVQEVLTDQIDTTAYFKKIEESREDIIQRAISDGNEILIATSPDYMADCLRAAIEDPTKKIWICSLNEAHRYIYTYYARMYEVKFILGALAGSLASNNKVGYIFDSPLPGQLAGINAFALGVQLTNPWAKVYLECSDEADIQAATNRLMEKGIRMISSLDMAKDDGEKHERYGLFYHHDGTVLNVAWPIWRWDVYYEKMLKEILSNTSKTQYEESRKALNYYWGMSAGVVDIWYSDELPAGIRKLAELLKTSICNDHILPFHGELYDQNGTVHGKTGETLTLEELIKIDWLADNVIGSLPDENDDI